MAATTYLGYANCQLGSAPPPGFGISILSTRINSDQDFFDGGRHRVAGTTKYVGPPSTPVSRYVRLYDSISGRLVRAQWSTPQGAYSFDNIRLGNFFVMSQDYTGQYNGVIATDITSEVMA
ncbi:MAG: hypothetical protein ACKVOT_13840 [Polaromonas sp.]